MKKLLIFIICALFAPIVIFADMGAPAIKAYKAIIIADGGAIIYENPEDGGKATNEKIKKGEIVTISFEESGYALAQDYGYVKNSDISPVEKELKFKSSDWGKKTSGIVLKKTDIRKGPAGAYEKTGVLNPGDAVTIYLSFGSDGGSSWAYVENKGYVDIIGGAIAYTPRTSNLIAVYDISIGNENIKSGTIFNAKIYNLDAWSFSYYIVYNGNKAVISTDKVEPENDEYTVTTLKDLNIYESLLSIDDKEKNYKKIGTLKKGETFKTNYVSEDNYSQKIYYDNGSIKGWLYIADAWGEVSKVDVEYPKDRFEEKIVDEKAENEDISNETIDVEKTKTTNQTVSTPQSTTTNEKVEKKVPNNLYIYIGFALCICVTAVVTTLLVNKKNKKEKVI